MTGFRICFHLLLLRVMLRYDGWMIIHNSSCVSGRQSVFVEPGGDGTVEILDVLTNVSQHC